MSESTTIAGGQVNSPSSATDYGTSSSMYSESMYSEPVILSAKLIDGRMEIVKKADPTFTYCTYQASSPPPKIWKEIYAASGNEIVLVKTIQATWHPGQSEYYEFEEK